MVEGGCHKRAAPSLRQQTRLVPFPAPRRIGYAAVVNTIAAAAPAIAMLAAFACLIGGGVLIAKKRDVRKGTLMLVMAVVLIANVLIWTL